MDFSKVSQGLWLFFAGCFIGSVSVLGINPVGIGFFNGVCLVGGNYVLAGIGVILGLGLKFSLVHTIRYGLMILALMIMLNMKSVLYSKNKVIVMSAFAGSLVGLVNLSVYYFLDNLLSVEQVFLEGVIVFSATVIFHYGLYIIKTDYARIAVDSQAALGVMALATTILFGMPIEIFGIFSLGESFAIFSILFATHKFGFGIGISWTVISGGIMAAKTGDVYYLTGWLVIALFAYAASNIVMGGRGLYALLFSVTYLVVGSIFFQTLLTENDLKALFSALFIFIFLPPRYMLRVDDIVKKGELAENSPEWGRLVINRVNSLASAFKRIEYTLASDTGAGIGFNDVGEIIEGFASQLEDKVPLRKTIEAKIIENLALKQIQVKNLVLIKNKSERYEVYITARVRRGRLVHGEALREVLEKQMNVRLVMKEESRRIVSRNYEMFCYMEKPAFICQTAVKRFSRYDEEICGDNYYIGDIVDGQKLIIISDGMGSGEKASIHSKRLIDALEELFAAGFDKEMSIKLVNTYLADRNKGETFTTLDMLVMDLHTGYGKIYKQGAATTYIRRGEWLEMVKSTSLPVGVVEGAVCEKCSKKFYNNDVIIMVSDGVLESIVFENKEDYMGELIMDIDMGDPLDIATDIMDRIKAVSGSRLKDDATIIVCKVVKTL